MPQFELEQNESEGVGTATFHKESDYKTVTLTNDKFNKPRLLHKIQADKLIGQGLAKEVKGAKPKEREIETVTTKAPEQK